MIQAHGQLHCDLAETWNLPRRNHCIIAPGRFAVDSKKAMVVSRNHSAGVCVLGQTGVLEGMVIVQATCEPRVCTVTLDKTILYSWQSYKVMLLVMIEKWTGKVYPQCRSFTTTLLKITPVHFPGTVEQQCHCILVMLSNVCYIIHVKVFPSESAVI